MFNILHKHWYWMLKQFLICQVCFVLSCPKSLCRTLSSHSIAGVVYERVRHNVRCDWHAVMRETCPGFVTLLAYIGFMVGKPPLITLNLTTLLLVLLLWHMSCTVQVICLGFLQKLVAVRMLYSLLRSRMTFPLYAQHEQCALVSVEECAECFLVTEYLLCVSAS
jgi:hypothetical protein